MEVLGGVSSTIVLQPRQKVSKPLEMSMRKFDNPLLQFNVAGEYYTSVLEYFSGANNNIWVRNSTQGVPRSMALTISCYHMAYD